MLARDAVAQGINEDGWYELNEDGSCDVFIENGKVMRGTAPDGLGLRTTYPYMRYDARSYTSVVGEYELADLLSGKITMM